VVGGRTQTKLMLNSTLVEVEVEVGVELGKNYTIIDTVLILIIARF